MTINSYLSLLYSSGQKSGYGGEEKLPISEFREGGEKCHRGYRSRDQQEG